MYTLLLVLAAFVLAGCRSSRQAAKADAQTGASQQVTNTTGQGNYTQGGKTDSDKKESRRDKKRDKDNAQEKKTSVESVAAKMSMTLESAGNPA